MAGRIARQASTSLTGIGLALALAACTSASPSPAPTTPTGGSATATSPPADPSAAALAAGHWHRTADAPFNVCRYAAAVSTGTGFALVQPSFDGCTAGAAIYDASSDSWRPIATPPMSPPPHLYWSGSDILAQMSNRRSYVWTGTTDTWRRLPALPEAFVRASAATWWNGAWLVASGAGDVEELTADGWQPLPRLPALADYEPDQSSLTAAAGRLLATVIEVHSRTFPHGYTIRVQPAIFRLAGNHWRALSRSHSLPLAISGVAPLGAGLIATGSGCPCFYDCDFYSSGFKAALLAADGTGQVRAFPQHRVLGYTTAVNGPSLVDVEAGEDPSTRLYDAASKRWFAGPPLRLSQDIDTYDLPPLWTTSGVVVLTVPAEALRHPGQDLRLAAFILRPA
jgi:hypothetical protein